CSGTGERRRTRGHAERRRASPPRRLYPIYANTFYLFASLIETGNGGGGRDRAIGRNRADCSSFLDLRTALLADGGGAGAHSGHAALYRRQQTSRRQTSRHWPFFALPQSRTTRHRSWLIIGQERGRGRWSLREKNIIGSVSDLSR